MRDRSLNTVLADMPTVTHWAVQIYSLSGRDQRHIFPITPLRSATITALSNAEVTGMTAAEKSPMKSKSLKNNIKNIWRD